MVFHENQSNLDTANFVSNNNIKTVILKILQLFTLFLF